MNTLDKKIRDFSDFFISEHSFFMPKIFKHLAFKRWNMTKYFLVFLTYAVILSGCKTLIGDLQKNDRNTSVPKLSESMVQKQLNGVDFFAKGNQPSSWTLEIDFEKNIRFISIDGTQMISSSVKPMELTGKNGIRFTSKATNGEINIFIYDESCNDDLSGELFKKRVEVSVNKSLYRGCGSYLYNPALHGKWILQKINNHPISDADFANGPPMLELDLNRNHVSVKEGCTNFKGNINILGSKIKFSNLAISSKCSENRENLLIPIISNQMVDYYFRDGLLYFYLKDDGIVIFKRK